MAERPQPRDIRGDLSHRAPDVLDVRETGAPADRRKAQARLGIRRAVGGGRRLRRNARGARRSGAADHPGGSPRMSAGERERLERWRLLLGGQEADGIGVGLTGRVLAMDKAMAALY